MLGRVFLSLAACTGAIRIGDEQAVMYMAMGIPHFDSFLQEHGRSYAAGCAEYDLRRAAYEKRAAAAAHHNSQKDRLWTAGPSHLWDWTEEEISQLHGWRRIGVDTSSSLLEADGITQEEEEEDEDIKRKALPDIFDWGTRKVASLLKMKNQGSCGSCWAVAAATVLQAHAEIHTGKRHTFSAQQLVNCVPNEHKCGGDGGCKGATVELAYDYTMRSGLQEEEDVPYLAKDNACLVGQDGAHSAAGFGMVGYKKLPENEYEPLMRALAFRGPVAVSVDASTWSMYGEGIFNDCAEDAVINHAVVLVEYGNTGKKQHQLKFWKIKNSWGDRWGEAGHIRLLREDSEETKCGTDRQPSVGTGCEGGPSQVKTCGNCGILYDSVVPKFKKL